MSICHHMSQLLYLKMTMETYSTVSSREGDGSPMKLLSGIKALTVGIQKSPHRFSLGKLANICQLLESLINKNLVLISSSTDIIISKSNCLERISDDIDFFFLRTGSWLQQGTGSGLFQSSAKLKRQLPIFRAPKSFSFRGKFNNTIICFTNY